MRLVAADTAPPAPPPPTTTYTVVSGDTLSSIAERAGLGGDNWQGIYQANQQLIGSDPGMILPGQTLQVPGATSVAAPLPPPPAPAPAPAQSSSGDGDGDADDGVAPAVAPPPPPPAPAPDNTTAATSAPASSSSSSGGTDSSAWACIRYHESGNNYSSPGGGAYQFTDQTWQSLGYSGSAQDYPPSVQDAAAQQLQSQDGWAPWTTAGMCGL